MADDATTTGVLDPPLTPGDISEAARRAKEWAASEAERLMRLAARRRRMRLIAFGALAYLILGDTMAKLKGKKRLEFLERMKRGRERQATHKPAKKSRAKHQPAHHAEAHVTKKKKKKTHHGRRHHGKLHRFLPSKEQLAGTAASFVYGKLEALADKNADHYLNRAPSVISEVGRSGNVALLAWVIGVATKQPLVKAAAAGLINVAAYQYARGAGFTEKEQKFKLAGPSHRGALPEARDEVLVERFLRARAAEHGG